MNQQNHMVEPEELMAYLDGELSPERAADAASHLEECTQCQKLAADLQEVSQMLMAWQVEKSKLGLTEDVAEGLNKPGSHKSAAINSGSWLNLLSPRHWPKPVWGLAIVALIAAVVLTPSLMRRSMPRYGSEMAVPRTTAQHQDTIRAGQLGLRATPPLAAPTPRPGAGALGKLLKDADADVDQVEEETSNVPTVNGPMIIRTAELEVFTKEFEKARSSVDEILKRRHGYVGELNVNTPTGSARSLTGTLRVPASQLDATLADIKGLGTTQKESQEGEEVTQQYVDLQARLANARHTEQRLTDILRERTGKLSDVLAVEMQISRVRGVIEQMEAQRKNMKNQVDFATVTLTVTEEYKEQLKAVPPSTGRQFRNAAVEGYRSLVDGIISVLLWLLSAGPTLLVWAAILFFPVRYLWKKLRPKFMQKASEV
ncbi:MAG TPA: DUF4349 domain-containing protein [Candidatus Angelobacter sp.]